MSSPTMIPHRAPSVAAVSVVDRLRRVLSTLLLARALLVGALVALVVLLGARLALMAGAPASSVVISGASWMAAMAGLLAAVALRWRDGRVDRTRAALWAEERSPRDFVLVTAAEPQSATVRNILESMLGRGPEIVVASAVRRALMLPFLLLLLFGAVLLLLPDAAAIEARRDATTGVSNAGGGDGRGSIPGLGSVSVTVRPPAYSGLPSRTERDPASMAVLVGSSVRMEGSTPGTVLGSDGRRAIPVARDGDDWTMSLTMPDSATVTRVEGGEHEWLLLLTPIPDSIPVVTLASSVRDTVLQAPVGIIDLSADASDDLGMTRGWFEYIVSSGEGESFTFQGGTLGDRELKGARSATLSARLDEGDSLAVDGAPPPALDTAALSQRMLLEQTIKLEEQRPRLTRDTLLARASRISADQTRLRKLVGEMAYSRLGDDPEGEHSHFAVNKPLLEAYNHMWDATRALDMGEPANAIPPMRRALEALQLARQAERIYLRGRPPTVVVDIAGARLQGKTNGESNVRTARGEIDPATAVRAGRLERALRLLADPMSRAGATDSLLLIQADALRSAPSLASAIGTAIAKLRAGEDATEALLQARRAAAGAGRQGALTPWSTIP